MNTCTLVYTQVSYTCVYTCGIGWHVGTITRRNYDGRRKRGGAISNFYVHYEVDDDEGAAVLSLEAYGGDDESSWLLLEPIV